jgi:hypothetical protein
MVSARAGMLIAKKRRRCTARLRKDHTEEPDHARAAVVERR